MEEEVIYLYFIEKMLQKDIAKKVNISESSVCRIIKKDQRYMQEKENRKRLNKIKRNKDIQRRVEGNRKKNSSDIQILKKMHEQASLELSGGNKPISNRAFRDWNTSAYKYNYKNKCYELKKDISTGVDVPKRIKWTAF